jgi:hypothetical protein
MSSQINKAQQFVTPLVSKVDYVEGYVLRLYFSDNTQKEINFEAYLREHQVFKPFLDITIFKKVRLDYVDLTWPGNILDFHHSSLYNWSKQNPLF